MMLNLNEDTTKIQNLFTINMSTDVKLSKA